MALQYREVTGYFTARIPDSGDADLNPDTVPLTGNVTFHPEYRKPLVFPGEHIVLEPINAIIIDGQLMGEVIQNEDVVLQALHLPVTMDERANQTWSWTMRFHGMTLGQYGETVEIPDVRFVIEEGDGPLDLSTVPQTTARASSNFITRGAPGPGLQDITAADGELTFLWDTGQTRDIPMPDAVPGPKGDKGDRGAQGPQGTISLIGDSATITVDDSVGRRVTIGNQMVYGDTGLRNITNLITAGQIDFQQGGGLFLERQGMLVTLWFDRAILPEGATAGFRSRASLPSGFYPPLDFRDTIRIIGGGGAVNAAVVYTTGGTWVDMPAVMSYMSGALRWTTRDTWPTTLPGTPA